MNARLLTGPLGALLLGAALLMAQDSAGPLQAGHVCGG